jgi:hypothetical protein
MNIFAVWSGNDYRPPPCELESIKEKKMSADTAQMADHQLLIAGQASKGGVERTEVRAQYGGSVVGRVAQGDAGTVDQAVRLAHAAVRAGGFPRTSAPPCWLWQPQ